MANLNNFLLVNKMGTMSKTKAEMRKWMLDNLEDFWDGLDLNTTGLVEAWDSSQGTGEETLDPNHFAWDVAHEIYMERRSQQ